METNRDKPLAVVRQMVRAENEKEFRALGAVAAFEILGSNAVSILPELARLASIPPNTDFEYHDPKWGLEGDENPSRRAIFALANVGPEALPYLLDLATNQSANIQCDALHLISKMETNALPAIPLLLEVIQHPTSRAVWIAVRTLGILKLSPETVIPALTNALENRSLLASDDWTNGLDARRFFVYFTFTSIAAYGPSARPALPTILDWLDDPDPLIPEMAADTLGKFTFEPDLVVPHLIKALDSPNPYLVRSAALSLGEFGSAATSGIPALIKIRDTGSVTAKFAARRALERITNSAPTPISAPTAQ
jgi:hypothetical protein